MPRTVQTTLGVVFGSFFCLFLAWLALGIFFGKGGCGCVMASGRGINLMATGWSCSMMSDRDTATITAAGHTIVVAPRVIQVDGRRIAAIDANIKQIEIDASRGEIDFVGDGQPLAIWRR